MPTLHQMRSRMYCEWARASHASTAVENGLAGEPIEYEVGVSGNPLSAALRCLVQHDQAALRVMVLSVLLKYGASFFFALNTLHCTVPIGISWAAAIS
jgi:hypothetical protein